MISELQIGTQRLLAPIHKALRDKLVALVIDPFTTQGQEVWVERLDVLDVPTISSALIQQANVIVRSNFARENYAQPDTRAQIITIAQDVHVSLSSRIGAVFIPVAQRTFIIRFQVSLSVVEGQGVALSLGLDSVPVVLIGPDDPELVQYIVTQVGTMVSPIVSLIPFDTFFLPNTSIKDFVTTGRTERQKLPLLNTGLALSADQTFLSIRIEVPGFPNTVDPWTAFFQGLSTNHLALAGSHGFVPAAGSSPWCLFIDGDAFRNSIGQSMESALSDAKVFDISPSVAVDWSAPGGGSRITVTVNGHKTVATVFDEGVVTSMTITLTLDLSVPTTNEIHLEAGFSFDVSIAGIDVTFLVQLLAELLLRKVIGSSVSASDLIGSDSPLGPLGQNIQCVVTSLSSLSCQVVVAIPSVLGSLQDSRGLDQGLLLMGAGEGTVFLTDPRPVLEVTPFQWNAGEVGCPTPEFIALAGKQAIFSVLSADGGIGVTNTVRGSRPLQINHVDILDDALGIYAETVTGSANEFLVSAHCGYPRPPFFDHPYPLVLAIYTNAGVKLAKLEAPPKLDDAFVKKMVSDAIKVALPHCEQLISPWGLSFNPQWNVDPAPDLGDQPYVQIWELEVPASSQGGTLTVNGGINQGEVRIIGSAGRPLSASFATRRGQGLHLDFQQAAAPKWRGAGTAAAEPGRLGMLQTLLCKSAHLNLGPALKSILLVAGASGPLLAAGLRSKVAIYDMSAPSDPKKVFELPLDEVNGLVEGRLGRILAWGDFGMVAIDRLGSAFATTVVMDAPIQTVSPLEGRWYLSTAEGIVVLDCELERERCIRRPGGYCGSLVGLRRDLLWIAAGEAFRLSSCSSRWSPVASEPSDLPYRFESVYVGRTPYLFAPHERRGGSLWTLGGGRLSIECEFDEDPWFRRSARIAEVFATADRHGQVVVYAVAGQARR